MKKRKRWKARDSALAPLGERVARNPRSSQRGRGPGEGVKLVKTQYPYRRTRSVARTAGQINKVRELRQFCGSPPL